HVPARRAPHHRRRAGAARRAARPRQARRVVFIAGAASFCSHETSWEWRTWMDAKRPPPEWAQARERFLELVAELRPELHRYCARLTGSIVDGEDVVQDTLAKAYYAVSMASEIPPLRPLLFRIAHNTALDVLRRYEHRHVETMAEVPDIAPQVDRV